MLNLSTIRTLLFDMDGVVYRGKTRLPGMLEMLAFCDEQAIPYACITNNASKTQEQFEHKLSGMDIAIPGSRVFSSALVTGHYLRSHYPRGTRAFVIGMDGLREAVFGDGWFEPGDDNAQVVVLGIDFNVTYETFKTGCLAIRRGADYIVTNPDRAFPSEEGLLPGAGALAALLQTATDTDPLIIGKPEPTMFRVALEMLDAQPDTTLVVGDRLETDIAGAQNAGLKSVLVLTGVTTREHLAHSPYQPDDVYEGLPELLAAWQEQLAAV